MFQNQHALTGNPCKKKLNKSNYIELLTMEKKREGRERKKNKKKGFSLNFSLAEREGVRSLGAKADTSQVSLAVEARTALWFCDMTEARGEGPGKNMINYSGLQDSNKNVNATLSPIFASAE